MLYNHRVPSCVSPHLPVLVLRAEDERPHSVLQQRHVIALQPRHRHRWGTRFVFRIFRSTRRLRSALTSAPPLLPLALPLSTCVPALALLALLVPALALLLLLLLPPAAPLRPALRLPGGCGLALGGNEGSGAATTCMGP